MNQEERLAVIAVILENPTEIQCKVNQIISEAGEVIIGRMGIPDHSRNLGTIALIVEGTEDEINALTGRLGNVPGVSARATMAKRA
ncbi:MAG TPA: CopG family transcriptional regulator [Firmicutes bacterium]|nr:CopG family transcriptional regulator [Bacillota bacterium]